EKKRGPIRKPSIALNVSFDPGYLFGCERIDIPPPHLPAIAVVLSHPVSKKTAVRRPLWRFLLPLIDLIPMRHSRAAEAFRHRTGTCRNDVHSGAVAVCFIDRLADDKGHVFSIRRDAQSFWFSKR